MIAERLRLYPNSNPADLLIDVARECLRAGYPDQAEVLIPKIIAAGKHLIGIERSHVLAVLGEELVGHAKMSAAEPVLRDCLAIREKLTPDEWWTAYTESFLGEALARQGKYVEAEPRLVRGYENLMKVRFTKAQLDSPPFWGQRIRDRQRITSEQLVHLYVATGKQMEAAKWRAETAKYPFVAPPPRAVPNSGR